MVRAIYLVRAYNNYGYDRDYFRVLKAFKNKERAIKYCDKLNALSVEAKNVGVRLVPTSIQKIDPEWSYENTVEYLILETTLEE